MIMPTNTPAVTPALTPPAVVSARLPGLDGLRAIAVASVLVFHLTPGALIGGYLGVDIFFVISGFLITGLLLRERLATGRIQLGKFWRRRARRLLPALGVLLLVCSSAALLVGGDVLLGLARQVLGATTFSSNWLFIAEGASYFDESAPEIFRNLWSLAVEEQFYLLWPPLLLTVLLVPRRWVWLTILTAFAIASAVVMAILYLPGTDATRVYYGTDSHSFGLALGAALAILSSVWPTDLLAWPRRLRQLMPVLGSISVAGIIGLAIVMPADAPLVYQGGLALVAVLSALAIAGAIAPGSWLGTALDFLPLRWIGERSYGLYLWHWPVVILIGTALPALDSSQAGGWILGAGAATITIAAATLSYRFVEQPIRRDGFRVTMHHLVAPWKGGRTAIIGATVALVLVTGSGTASALALLSDPGQSVLEAEIAEGREAVKQAAELAAAAKSAELSELAVEKVQPPLASGEQISAIGDSVMLAAAPEVQAAFPGILIDATVSRQMLNAPEAVESMISVGTLRPVLVLGLGTNGPIGADTLERLKTLVGDETQLIVVNVQAPRGWVPEVNAILARFAQQYRGVELANWHDAIQPSLDVLASDEVHPGGPIGGQIYAGAIRDALQRLAELPPLRDENDRGLAPRPI